MTQGWNQSGPNEFHKCIIREITDNSWMDKPYVTLRCTGYINPPIRFYKPEGIDSYPLTIRVYGCLMGYAVNELAVGDKIFVAGCSDTAQLGGRYNMRVTTAVDIYKGDWFHYFDMRLQ